MSGLVLERVKPRLVGHEAVDDHAGDRRGAGQHGHRLGRAAVIGERAQARRVGEDVGGRRRAGVEGRAQQIVAQIGGDAAVDVRASVAGHDGILQREDGAVAGAGDAGAGQLEVVDGAAGGDVRSAATVCDSIAGEGGVDGCNVAVQIEDAAAQTVASLGFKATRAPLAAVAGDRAIGKEDCAGGVENRPAQPRSATRVALGSGRAPSKSPSAD